jgi:hypothetical protein
MAGVLATPQKIRRPDARVGMARTLALGDFQAAASGGILRAAPPQRYPCHRVSRYVALNRYQ